MNRGIRSQGRYPVPQSHQLPATKIPQQVHDLNYVPTSDVRFYNTHSEAQLRTTSSEAWSQSSFPPVPPEQNHNPLPPPTTGYWQQPQQQQPQQQQHPYVTEPLSIAPPNDPWKWTVDNGSHDLNSRYEQPQTNFQTSHNWQHNSTPYQQLPDSQLNQPHIHQQPPGTGYSSHHFAPWNPPSMDPDSRVAENDSPTHPWPDPILSNSHTQWQNFNHENSEPENAFWSYGAQQTSQPSQWSGDNFSQHSNASPVVTSNWNDQNAEESLSLARDNPSQMDCNYLQGSSDSNVKGSGDNIYSSEHNVHDISCKNVDTFDSYSASDTSEQLKVDNNCVPTHDDGAHLVRKDITEEEYKSDSRLSAFFNNDVQEPVVPEENVCAEMSSSETEGKNGASNSVAVCETELQGPYCVGNPPIADDKNICIADHPSHDVVQENNSFIQNESARNFTGSVNLESSDCPVVSPEDSPNQEVPEPSPSTASNSNKMASPVNGSQHTKGMLTEDLKVTHEPLNQQVPRGSEDAVSMSAVECENTVKISQEQSLPLNQQVPLVPKESISVPSERDRIVIRAREESPFKPPAKLLNSKGLVVQQEINPLPAVSNSPSVEEMQSDQDVNMETVPDNLERPPDAEEQKKQSSWSTSLHRHHARNHIASSPSTSLWDSPDIPSVTLMPAAGLTFPPVHKHEERQQSLSLVKESAPNDKIVSKTSESSIVSGNEDQLNSRSQAFGESSVRSSEPPTVPVVVQAVSSQSQTTAQSNHHAGSTLNSSAVHSASPTENCKLSETKISERRTNFQNTEPNNSDFRSSPFSESVPAKFSAGSETVPSPSRIQSENKPSELSSEFESPHRNGNISHGSLEQFPPPSGHRLTDSNRCASFDERNYYPERERSRPPSHMSLHGPGDERYHEQDYRRQGPPYYDRVPSRMSESEAMRTGRQGGRYPYYEQQYYDERYSYHRDDDYYNRGRNYKGFEYDPYRPERHPYYAYYDPYRYGYSNYNYGFYDELYRNDPRYKQQMEERYRQYYAKLGYDTDQERSSVHSGRSSAELPKDMPVRYAEPDGDSNESEYSAYNQQYYGYDEYSPKPSSTDLATEQVTATAASRLTPAKFSCAHPVCNFSSSGFLVTIIPTHQGSVQPAPVELHSIQVLMENTESFEELKQYQGPLIRGKTHKNDIIEFCVQKIKHFTAKKDLPDRESYILLWELMVLLLRQNGSVAGSDIAELLLKDHEVLRPAPLLSKPNAETPQGDCALPDVGEHSNQVPSGDTSSPDEGIVVSHDKSILNSAASIDVDKVTRKFREFLLFGHKKDALEWAMKHGLWGHALFLASKMDLRTYANVMTRFANSLTLNDPLQTLYQLMSGRQPAAVTCVVDKKWGDWRPHLAMILSNPSSHTEVDLRSITALGDTLANSGCLPAAHFCYLMAQVEFGSFSRKSSKMVLLSSNHLLPFQEFATNEAIQCTEIYEYAQSLANPGFMLPHLQAYKFIYATRLAEHGFLQEALHYCEIISYQFQQNADLFSTGFVDEVLKLATKLKFHDPVFIQGQGEWEEQDDPEWLQNLSFLLQSYKDGVIQNSGDLGNAVPSLPAETNLQEYSVESADDSAAHQMATEVDSQNQNYYTQPVQPNFYQQNNWVNQDSMTHTELDSHGVPHQEVAHYQNDMATNQWNVSNEQPNTYEDLEKSADQGSSPISSQGNTSFDYYGTSIQQGHVGRQTSRERTNSSSSVGTVIDRRSSTLSTGSGYGARPPPTSSTTRTVKEDNQKVEKKEDKPKSQVGRAWLGGIFSKLIPKGPNQMILPDDKNPTIVWDSSKNRWINTDSNEEDEVNKPVAPPTDIELLGNQNSPELSHTSAQPPLNSTVSTTNRFQRPKTKGMRQNYVDILNPGGSTASKAVPEALFPPPLPSQSQTSASNFFIPSVPVAEDQPADFVSAGHSSFNASSSLENEDGCTTGSPLMFDPAEFDSRKAGISSLRHSVGPAGRRTYPT